MRQISIKHRSNHVLYNVTIGINPIKIEEWARFMREDHLPKIFASDCFESYRMCRIIDENTESATIAVQYLAISMEHLEKYHSEYAPQLQREHVEKFGSEVVTYRSVLSLMEDGVLENI